ncbi:MAG TPA: transporter substrate-binding domain-containing protein [Alphaproteobacteria bacterium]|nr:transporter substrate-binding domain-containing protein [Alphaproteobacteria bacterium]
MPVILSLFPFSDSLQAREIKDIVASGHLIVGICQIDQPPFYEHSPDLKGHDITLANGLAKSLGVKVTFDEASKNWDDLVERLEHEKIDLAISFLSQTSTRAKTILYSKPYAKIHQAILANRLRLTHALNEGRKTLQNIFTGPTESLLVYEGSSYIKFAREIFQGHVKLQEFKTQKEIMESLLEGLHTGFICDQVEIKTYMNSHPDAGLKLLPITLRNHFDLISVGIGPKNYDLQQFVNIYLQSTGFFIDLDDSFKVPLGDKTT